MLTLVNLLIIFFSFLILYQIILDYFKDSIVEGMIDAEPTISSNKNKDYKQYDKNISDNAFLLAQQNAGNIEYLKQRIDSVENINQQVQDLSGNVTTLQTQVNGLVQAQQDYANQMTGGVAPEISGAVPTEGSND